MKGVIGCDGGGDSAEMIRRCLSCSRPYCRGEESCAQGHPLICVPVGRNKMPGFVRKLASEGMTVPEIARLVHRTQTSVREMLA